MRIQRRRPRGQAASDRHRLRPVPAGTAASQAGPGSREWRSGRIWRHAAGSSRWQARGCRQGSRPERGDRHGPWLAGSLRQSRAWARLTRWADRGGAGVSGGLARLVGAAGDGAGAVAFSPDGEVLATGSGDGTVHLWNPATGRPAGKTIQTGSVFGVPAVAFSPDGTLLATGGGDGTVRLWNPATGQPASALLQATSLVNG